MINIYRLYNNPNEIYLEIILMINKKIYEDGIIDLNTKEITENKIFNMINKGNNNGSIYD